MDDGAKSNFGAHKEFTVLNFLKYKYNVKKSRGIPRDYLAKIVSYLPVGGWFRKKNRVITLFLIIVLNISNLLR